MLEGTRRLSLVLGLLGGAAGLLVGLGLWLDLGEPELAQQVFVLCLPLLGFLIPWGTIRVGSWVVEGFVKDWGNRRAKRLTGGLGEAPTVTDKSCTACGTQVLDDVGFCHHCGVNLAQAEPSPSDAVEGLDEVEEDTQDAANEGLVVEAGGGMPAATRYTILCTSCGREISADAFFCRHCSAKIRNDPQRFVTWL